MNRQSGWVNIATVVVVMLLGVVMVGGFQKVRLLSPTDPTKTYKPIADNSNQNKESLHLKDVKFSTPIPTATPTVPQSTVPTTPTDTPTPTVPRGGGINPPDTPNPTNPPDPTGNICAPGTPRGANGCVCQKETKEVLWCTGPEICQCPYSSGPGLEQCPILRQGSCYFKKDKEGYTKYSNHPDCFYSCIDKPLIYLYPTEKMLVDVKLDIPGFVTVSDPYYPPLTGWQDVLAFPDGTIHYKNTRYHYLYYETAVNKEIIPDTGVIIPTQDIEPVLQSYLTRYGLNALESKEFLDYWVPRLTELNSPYIFFSLYTDEEKELVDSVHINPKPDTFIHFLAYFKEVSVPYSVKPLSVPSQVPERHGFTVVEWGGTIDSDAGSAYFR